MKKLVVSIFFVFLTTLALAITTIVESEPVFKNEKEIGEVYIAKFENNKEKEMKINREKKYMMSKDDFKYFLDKDGIMYMAAYDTPFGYTASFKAFCGDKYISVNGDYNNFDELKEYFLSQTKECGYNF